MDNTLGCDMFTVSVKCEGARYLVFIVDICNYGSVAVGDITGFKTDKNLWYKSGITTPTLELST
jgi:hypothetical protein